MGKGHKKKRKRGSSSGRQQQPPPQQQQPSASSIPPAATAAAAAVGTTPRAFLYGHSNNNDQRRGQRGRCRTVCVVDQAAMTATTDDEAGGDNDRDIISTEDLAVTIRTIERLTRTMNNHTTTAAGVVQQQQPRQQQRQQRQQHQQHQQHHKELYRRLRASLHPLVVAQMKKYDRPVDYRHRTTEHLKSRRYADAYTALCACRDWDQIPPPGTVQRWVRDCGSASPAVQMTLLQAILAVSSSSSSFGNSGRRSTTTTAATGGVIIKDHHDDDNNNGAAHHHPTVEQIVASAAASVNNNNNHGSPEKTITHLPGWKWWVNEDPMSETLYDDNNNAEEEEGDNDDTDPPPKEEAEDRSEEEKDNDDTAEEAAQKRLLEKNEQQRHNNLFMAHARIVYQEAAADRTPPNHYDLHLHGNVHINWDDANDDDEDDEHQVHRHDAKKSRKMEETIHVREIPFLPYPSRIIAAALSKNECQRLIDLMTQLSYRPDHPTHLVSPTGIDSCEVMMDDRSCEILTARVQPFLPATLLLIDDTKNTVLELHSLNPRWRGFRYGQHCTYRPHLDGSWPLCYMTKEGKYHCCNNNNKNGRRDNDASDAEPDDPTTNSSSSDIKSYLTFLIYLNDDFQGGETRFYLPHQLSRGIVPKTGSILIFPQGNLASLIHEGAAVTSGVKYVIRTDVLYRPRRRPGPTADTTTAVA